MDAASANKHHHGKQKPAFRKSNYFQCTSILGWNKNILLFLKIDCVKRSLAFSFIAVSILLIFGQCQQKGQQITRGIYYWKTNLTLNAYEQQRLNALKVEKMYLRFFDVDWRNGQFIPVAVMNPSTVPKEQIIPVVFITVDALRQLHSGNSATLAQKIARLLDSKISAMNISVSEIQIDCDWTAHTKNAYFSLLSQLKKEPIFQDKKLSVTVRLHQVKHVASSGVPPADRGLLMCYNMGNLRAPGTENSIVNWTAAKSYLQRIDHYPLPLDLAFPLFHWALLFDGEKMNGIIRSADRRDFEQAKELFVKEKESVYRAIKDSLWLGYPLKKNQKIRFEDSDFKTVSKIAKFALDKINNPTSTIILYHCDSAVLSKYTDHELETLYGNNN